MVSWLHHGRSKLGQPAQNQPGMDDSYIVLASSRKEASFRSFWEANGYKFFLVILSHTEIWTRLLFREILSNLCQ
jgi:hypothetical protein